MGQPMEDLNEDGMCEGLAADFFEAAYRMDLPIFELLFM